MTEAGETFQKTQPVDLAALRAAAATSALHRVNGNIHHFCDRIEVTTGGRVAITGWAVGAAATEGISVLLDGDDIGQAEIGIERPDVGSQFRSFAHAHRADFLFGIAFPGSALAST